MAKLIYSAIMSLDGYVADEGGTFDWAAPDEVHALRQRPRHPLTSHCSSWARSWSYQLRRRASAAGSDPPGAQPSPRPVEVC